MAELSLMVKEISEEESRTRIFFFVGERGASEEEISGHVLSNDAMMENDRFGAARDEYVCVCCREGAVGQQQ